MRLFSRTLTTGLVLVFTSFSADALTPVDLVADEQAPACFAASHLLKRFLERQGKPTLLAHRDTFDLYAAAVYEEALWAKRSRKQLGMSPETVTRRSMGYMETIAGEGVKTFFLDCQALNVASRFPTGETDAMKARVRAHIEEQLDESYDNLLRGLEGK